MVGVGSGVKGRSTSDVGSIPAHRILYGDTMAENPNIVEVGGWGVPVAYNYIPWRFCFNLFIPGPDGVISLAEWERSKRAVLHMAEAAVKMNREYINLYGYQPVYDSPVQYHAENRAEDICDIPTQEKVLIADCDDLAFRRTAELQYLEGEQAARPWLTWEAMTAQRNARYHAAIWRASITSNLPPKMKILRKDGKFWPVIYKAPKPWDHGWIEDVCLVKGM